MPSRSPTTRPGADAPRICYFAHYDADAQVGEHVLHYLRALKAAGFAIRLGTPCDLPPAEQDKLEGLVEAVLMRPNLGMDFGSWIDLFNRYPPPDDALVLLANDSVYAPVGDLGAFVEGLLAMPADFYGAVASGEITPHLQSWFVLLRPEAHRAPAFRTLMRPGAITPAMSKTDVVTRYEMGMTGLLVASGLRFHAAYDWRRDSRVAGRHPFNATHLLWDELIASGTLPFVKVELLRYNPVEVANTAAWPAIVGARAPELPPLIAADLARRAHVGTSTPIVLPPSAARLKGAPDPIYRRQLRPWLLRDFRAVRDGRGFTACWNSLGLRALWLYTFAGRVVKWWVLDHLAALRHRPAPPA